MDKTTGVCPEKPKLKTHDDEEEEEEEPGKWRKRKGNERLRFPKQMQQKRRRIANQMPRPFGFL